MTRPFSAPRSDLERSGFTKTGVTRGIGVLIAIEPERRATEASRGRAPAGDMGLLTLVTVSARPSVVNGNSDPWTRAGALDNVWCTVKWSGQGQGVQCVTFDALRGGTVAVPGDNIAIGWIVEGGGSYDFQASANHATAASATLLSRTFAVVLGAPAPTPTPTSLIFDVPTFARSVTSRIITPSETADFSLLTGQVSAPVPTFTGAIPVGITGASLDVPTLTGLDRLWGVSLPERAADSPPVVLLVSFGLSL
jgi:hypothetical protein